MDREFSPLLDDVQDRIERYHELDPEHADLTDNVRPHPIKIPENERDRLRETARELRSFPWAPPKRTAVAGSI